VDHVERTVRLQVMRESAQARDVSRSDFAAHRQDMVADARQTDECFAERRLRSHRRPDHGYVVPLGGEA
jgi:hypothetical protein